MSRILFSSETLFLRRCGPADPQNLGAAQLLLTFSAKPRHLWVSAHQNMLFWACWMPAAAEHKAFHKSGNGKTKGFWCEQRSSAAACRTAPPLSPLITQHNATAAYIQFHTAAKKYIFRWVIGYRTSFTQYAASHQITEQRGFRIIFFFSCLLNVNDHMNRNQNNFFYETVTIRMDNSD